MGLHFAPKSIHFTKRVGILSNICYNFYKGIIGRDWYKSLRRKELRIALCDDDSEALIFLKELIESYCIREGQQVEIHCFSSGEEFLHSGKDFDIIFMDIYLRGIYGTDVIRAVRKSGNPLVVFITVSLEHALEAFGLNAVHYLVKPLKAVGVNEAMDRCLQRANRMPDKILKVKSGQTVIPIPVGSIAYIEVFNKVSVIHTKKNEIQVYASLDTLYEQLKEDCFMRAQRSYIVNMRFIDSFCFDHVVVQGGIKIILSRNNRAELKNQYQRFLFDLAREGDV